MTALLVIAILVFLIVVHEFGHFIAAKLFGVKVEEFGVGYPPRAFLFGRFGGTEYTLNWIPFGGFVRLFGEEEEHGHGSFSDAPRWKQAVILVAGVTMNALAAWVLFSGAYMVGVLHPVDVRGENTQLIVSQVVPASPADAAGLKIGDEIANVREGEAVVFDLTPEAVSDFVSSRAGKEIEVSFIHEGQLKTGIRLRMRACTWAGRCFRPSPMSRASRSWSQMPCD
jgi:regulator of sigma E protease